MPSRSLDSLGEGRAALQRGAWGAAKKAFARAVAAEPSAAALEGLGWAEYWLGEAEASLEHREAAYRLLVAGGKREDAARVAIGLAVASWDLRGEAVTTGWMERARHHLQRQPQSILHGWLAFYEGHVARLSSDDGAVALRCARRARKVAEARGDEQLRLLAGALEGLVLVNQGKVAEGMRRVDEATAAAMAGEMSDLDSVAQTCCMLLYACERVHDYRRAAEWQRRIAAFCREWKIESLFDVCSTQHAAMLAGSGKWREAEEQLERALARLELARPLVAPDAVVHLAELRRRQGRLDEALELLARAEGRTEAMLTRAAIALERGDAATAVDFAERLLLRRVGDKWIERAFALEIVVRASLLGGDTAAARQAMARLSAIAGKVAVPMVRGAERRAAGTLALAERRNDESRAALHESFDAFAAAAAPFEAAQSRVELARALAASGRGAAAAEELERAAAAFESLGAESEARRSRELRAALDAPEPAPHRDDAPLSRREREILGLIAGGLGDKELAARLDLSQHTVHRHVANILQKLSVSTRSAAVAAAVRKGWL